MKLKYTHPIDGSIVDAGPVRFDEFWYDDWLDGMVGSDKDIIFFIVTESTDVFEKEWDFNQSAYDKIVSPDVETVSFPPYEFGKGYSFLHDAFNKPTED